MSDSEVQDWVPAFNVYIKHVRHWWPRPVSLIAVDKDHEPREAWKVIIADTSDEAGALGYHDYTPGGRPISYVFAADDIQYSYNIPVTATHEIAEMIADPWISELFQVDDTHNFAKEICDPVEDDSLGYEINVPGFDPVLCSDFVTPNWFIPGSPGQYDWVGHIARPLQILPGGYMSVQKAGSWSQIDHEGKPADKTKAGLGRLERYARVRGSHLEL